MSVEVILFGLQTKGGLDRVVRTILHWTGYKCSAGYKLAEDLK